MTAFWLGKKMSARRGKGTYRMRQFRFTQVDADINILTVFGDVLPIKNPLVMTFNTLGLLQRDPKCELPMTPSNAGEF